MADLDIDDALDRWIESSAVRAADVRKSLMPIELRDIADAADIESRYGNVELPERWDRSGLLPLAAIGFGKALRVFVDRSDEFPLMSQIEADKTIRERDDQTQRLIHRLLATIQPIRGSQPDNEVRAADIDRALIFVLARLSQEEAAEIDDLIEVGSIDVTSLLERLGLEGLVALCLKLGAGDLAWLNGSELRPKAAAVELLRYLETIDERDDVDGG